MKKLTEHYRLWALAFSGVLIALTMSLWVTERRHVNEHDMQEDAATADALVASIEDRFGRLLSVSRAVRGLVEVKGFPTPDSYRQFLTTLQVSTEDLGTQATALVVNVPGDELNNHVRQALSQGHDDYKIRPPGIRKFYAPLYLVEPETKANVSAMGFDVATNPKALPALLRSGDSSEGVMSDRLQLVQDTGQPEKAAFVLYTPIYSAGKALDTVEDRRLALMGWVSMPFRLEDFFQGIHSIPGERPAFAIHEGRDAISQPSVYSSPVLERADMSKLTLYHQRMLKLGGKDFTLALYRPSQHGSLEFKVHDVMALMGTLVSGLLGTLLWVLGASRVRARLEAENERVDNHLTQENYRGLIEAIPDLMFEFDATGRYQLFQGPRKELLFATPDEFIGKSVGDVLPAAAARLCMEAMHEASLHGASYGQQIELPIGEETRWFELSTAVKSSSIGEPRFVMLSRDITARKLLELKLAQGQEKLRLAVQSAEVGLWEWDFASGALTVNDHWCAMLGLVPGNQVINMDLWTSLVHPADMENLERVVLDVVLDNIAQDFSIEVRARHADGHYIWILDRGRILERDENRLPVRVMGSHIDISVQKQDSERLKVSAHALTAATQGIVITDLSGAIESANPAFCEMTGYSVAELQGKNCRMLQGPETDPVTVQRLRSAIRQGVSFSGKLLNHRKNGDQFWNELHVTPIIEAGQVSHFVGVSRDITESVLAERQREKDQAAIEESHRILRKLSHRLQTAQEDERRRVAHELHDELGQTLTALKISLQTATRHTGSNEENSLQYQVHMVEDAIAQVRHLALALRPSVLDDLGLPAALRWLASSASINRDVKVDFDFAMDQQRLSPEEETACFRIVQEALTNVRRHAQASRVKVHLTVQQGRLELVIADDGRGFDVSSPSTRSASHPSLGLLGMQERASAIGGTLGVASESGMGCTITLQCALAKTLEKG